MKLIKDIRYFESEKENVIGYNPYHIGNIYQFDNRKLLMIATDRLVLKLRENNFCLPNFDHIYINLTSYLPSDEIKLANRAVDTYHPWFRYIDVGLSPSKFNSLSDILKIEMIINVSILVITKLYCNTEDIKKMVYDCGKEILSLGENTNSIFKQKKTNKNCVQIITRILDDGTYIPSVRIYDDNENLINEYFYHRPLKHDEFIFQFSSIVVGKTSCTIKPKNNSLSKVYNFQPLKYPYT